MEESIWRKAAIPIVIISFIMIGIFGISWYQERHRGNTLTIATGGKKGSYYAFAQALSKVVAKYEPNIKIKVIETEGSQQNEELLREKKVQLAIIQSDTAISPSSQVVSFLFPEMFHLVATKQSGIKSVSDLKGKRIALMPKGSGSYAMFWYLSKHYQLQEKDLKIINVPFAQASEALRQNKVDALFFVVALGNTGMSQLMQDKGVQLIPIEQAAALKLIAPAVEESQIPQGTYNGATPIPTQNLPTVAVRSVLLTHKDINQDVIYNITKIINESRNELVKEFSQASMIHPPESIRGMGFSFHPGAEAYYNQDQPMFIVEYAEAIGLLLSVSALCVSGILQLKMRLQSKQKNRADLYNLEIINLIDQIDTVDNLEQLDVIRSQLFEIFKKVVADLDKDRITPESFNSFTFPWEVALTTIRHKETLLINCKYPQTATLNDGKKPFTSN